MGSSCIRQGSPLADTAAMILREARFLGQRVKITSRDRPWPTMHKYRLRGDKSVILLSGNKQFRASWPVALVLLLIASPLFSQVIPTGTISGVVKDSSGASVPNATVTAVNTDSNALRTTTTGDDGERPNYNGIDAAATPGRTLQFALKVLF